MGVSYLMEIETDIVDLAHKKEMDQVQTVTLALDNITLFQE